MIVHFTARRFKAREHVKSHAIDAVKRLDRYYDGIVRGDVILSYERRSNSVKTAEVNLHVHGSVLTAKEQSEEFAKSIELAIEKLERQLSKYKTKLRTKDKKALRRVKERTPGLEGGDEE